MNAKTESTRPTGEAGVDQIRDGIEHTRREMSETLTALEGRLSPDVLSEKAHAEIDHIEARVKSAMKEGIEEAKAAAAVTLKEGVQEAKDAVTHGLKEARATVKKDLEDAITHTKHSVREATLGRVEDFATKAGDVMNDSRDTLVETIRQNPIPAALAGIGIAWLFMNRSSASRRHNQMPGYDANPYRGMGFGPESGPSPRSAVAETAGNVAHRVGDIVGQLGGAVGGAGSAVAGAVHDAGTAAFGAVEQGVDAVSHLTHDATAAAARLAHGASEGVSHLAQGAADGAGQLAQRAQGLAVSVTGSARQQARRLEGGVADSWEANPLAFGAVALVAGAALGYALPRTEKEDALMGEVRDQAVHAAAVRAGTAVHSLEHLTDEVGKKAKDAVKAATA